MARLAYITTSFGSLTHTFIRREIVALRNLGLEISLFGIRPEIAGELLDEEKALARATVYLYPLKIAAVIYANFWFTVTRPFNYFKTLFSAVANEEKDIFLHLKLIYHFFVSPYIALRIQQARVEHIHVHFLNVPSSIAMYVSGITGISYSVTIHSAGHASGKKHAPDMIGVKAKIKNAKFLCTISNYNIDYYDIIFPCRDKIFLTRSGIDIDIYKAGFDHANLHEEGMVRLISVGRFEEKKGFIYLIEACRHLKAWGVEFRLLMLGEGSLLQYCKQKTQEYVLTDRITFKGGSSQSTIRDGFEKSDICVAPSIESKTGEKEGIPGVVYEALAMGIPVIATRHSGIPEIVKDGETGILVSERDHVAIAEAVKLFIRDKDLRKKCIINGRKIVYENFNLERNSKSLKDIFDKYLT